MKKISHLTCTSLVMDTIHYKHRENTGEQKDHFQEIKSESSNMHLHNLRPETFCCTATCKIPRPNLLSYLCIKSTENVFLNLLPISNSHRGTVNTEFPSGFPIAIHIFFINIYCSIV